jgi:hypothetical protein
MVDSYYGSLATAREAAQLWLFSIGSSRQPAKKYDSLLGYHFYAKSPDGTTHRWFFGVAQPGPPGR